MINDSGLWIIRGQLEAWSYLVIWVAWGSRGGRGRFLLPLLWLFLDPTDSVVPRTLVAVNYKPTDHRL